MLVKHGRISLAALACITFLLILARAHVQSITIDEADTFLVWVADRAPIHWTGASNNHVVNSLLMRLTTAVFGVSHLSVRLPALAGAAIYLSAAVAICSRLQATAMSRLILFVLLAMNPMILDYLVAARGYGMASGFLLWALYFAIFSRVDYRTISCCLGLSFASCFAFGWVCVAVALLVVCQIARRPKRLQSLAELIVPAAVIFLFLSSYPALTIQRSELWFGTKSLGRTFGSLRDSFISQPNPNLLNPWVLTVVEAAKWWLIPAILTGLTGSLILLLFYRRSIARDALRQIASLFGVLAATVLLHYLMYRITRIPLPRDRTAIFIVPMAVLLFGITAGVRLPSRTVRIWNRSYRAVLGLTALYLVFCLRLSWFQEWAWDAETRQAYDVTAWWAKRCNVQTIPVSWHYVPSLNFYKAMSGRETLIFRNKDEFTNSSQPVYVLYDIYDQPLIEKNRLSVVWHGWSGIMVAVDPARGPQ